MYQQHPFQVIAKPIGPLCNLKCTYCYYLEKQKFFPNNNQFKMAEETLETFIKDYIKAQSQFRGDEIWFSWQGGEPTLLGIDYFQTIVELQKKYCPDDKTICNAFQTNGTLLNDEWAAFLQKNKFLVGLSIDGPQNIHDHYRKDCSDKPTFDKVMNGLKVLQHHHVEFNALTVVNRYNSRRPLEIYHFLKKAGFRHIQFIPIVERTIDGLSLAGPSAGGTDIDLRVTPWSVVPDDYGNFLNTIFDEWVKQDIGRIFVQFFDVQLGLFSGYPSGLCWFGRTCGQGLALEHNGNLYACDHYVYPEYLRGNINDTPLEELVASERQVRFGNDKQENLPQYCVTCEFLFACNGGCPKHRILETPSAESGLNYFCSSYKQFFSHAGPVLREMTNLIHQGRPASDFMYLNRQGRRDKRSEPIKIGRNQPCPCGSGKKYKRCCDR